MKYSTLKNAEHTVYVDEYDKDEIIGQPGNGIFHYVFLALIYLCWLITLPISWCCSFKGHMNKTVSEWGIEVARFELTHSTILKGSGGSDPSSENDEHGGHAAIIELVKSFTSNSSSSFQLPGMLPANLTQQMTPENLFSPNMASKPPATPKEMPALLKPEELFCVVKGVINEDVCTKVAAIYEFHVFNGVEEKIWTIDMKNSPGYVKDGSYSGIVDVKFTLSTEDFQNIFYGKLSPTDAYMSGKLEVDGSLQTATRLEYLVGKMKGK